MNKLAINYHNVDMVKLKKIINIETKVKIQERLNHDIVFSPAFRVIDNKKLLNQTINQINHFSKNKKNFFIFGTGGSNLGSKALINILQGKEKNNLSFYDNIDPIKFKNSINQYDLRTVGYIIISKSGKTLETLSQFACLIEIFEQKNQLNDFYKNCILITENKNNPLRKIGVKNKCKILDHEINIGGRFSVFSNVGMIPAILAGLDVQKIHDGAKNILDSILDNKFNQHCILANLFTSNELLKKVTISVLMTYSDSLFHYGKWYLQLWAESIGKNNKGITPLHAIGTTDQHSQLQLFLEGPKDKFFTFITTNHSKKGLKINKNILNQYNVSYLAGKYMGDLMQAEQQATIDTFIKNKFALREINIPTIDEFSLGQLMTLAMFETITTCNYLGVDPFNQPAVEQGKVLTKLYLS